MKNLSLSFTLIAAISMLLVTSCSKDEDNNDDTSTNKPTITLLGGTGLIAGDLTVQSGESLKFAWDARKHPNGKDLTTFTILEGNSIVGTNTYAGNSLPYTLSNADDEQYVDTISFAATTSNTYTFRVTDGAGLTAEASVVITVGAGANPITTHSNIVIGDQNNTTTGSFFATSNGTVYLQAAANSNSSLIDFIYYYGSTNKATLAAPNDATVNGGSGNLSLATGLTTQNATKFSTSSYTSTQFNAMTDDTEIAALTSISSTKVTNLASDEVLAFQTAAGKKGLIKIGTISTTTKTITITVKMEQ